MRGARRVRVRLTKAARADLRFWRHLGPEGRCMHPVDTVLCVHTDAVDVGWGGTVGHSLEAGAHGTELQGLWSAAERAKTIAWRELRALTLVLRRLPAAQRVYDSVRPPVGVRCWVDNQAVVYIVRAMVTASDEIMPELRRLKNVVDSRGIQLVRWLPSAANRHADRLSRTWDPGEPQLTRSVIESLTASLSTLIGRGTVFRHRLSGGEHPVSQRKQAEAALGEHWGDRRARFFNPPPALLGLTLAKMERERTRGVIVIPLWLETSFTARLRRIADVGSVRVLSPTPQTPLVADPRSGTESCPILLATIGLAQPRRPLVVSPLVGTPPPTRRSAAF